MRMFEPRALRTAAAGIAQLLRMDWFQPVHAKSIGARDVRALLTARKLLSSAR